jgi:hypothetical protein
MEWSIVIVMAIAILIILFPLAFVWYVCIGGICMAIKRSRVANLNLMCSIDTDCPPGYICVNGHCVPQKA